MTTLQELIDRNEYLERRNAWLEPFATLVRDLSRSEFGRCRGDSESQSPDGVSAGNPKMPPGVIVGYDMGGIPIRVPFNPEDYLVVEKWYDRNKK